MADAASKKSKILINVVAFFIVVFLFFWLSIQTSK